MHAFLPHISTVELMIIGFVSLLVFGNRLPSVMRSLGKSVTGFEKGAVIEHEQPFLMTLLTIFVVGVIAASIVNRILIVSGSNGLR